LAVLSIGMLSYRLSDHVRRHVIANERALMTFRPEKAEEVAETATEIEDGGFPVAANQAKKLSMSQLMRTSAVPIDALRGWAERRKLGRIVGRNRAADRGSFAHRWSTVILVA
jgi:hypothetical protein